MPPEANTGTATPSALFAYQLSGLGTRSVSGNVYVKTPAGWFKAPFDNLTLAPRTVHFAGPNVSYTRTFFRSPVQYVRFPAPVTIEYMWVGNVKTSGDADFGWDAKGIVQCQPPPEAGQAPLPMKPPTDPRPVRALDDVDDLDSAPPATAIAAKAVSMAAPGRLDCPVPFQSARAIHVRQPQWPQGYHLNTPITILVSVAIAADGSVDDTWLLQPSGVDAFDNAALKAAHESTYKNGTAFCLPSPGTYIFHAVFSDR